MKVKAIGPVSQKHQYTSKITENITALNNENNNRLLSVLESLASINKISLAQVSFKGSSGLAKPDYDLNLSLKELVHRSSPDELANFELLKPDSDSYENLKTGDKKALAHLVKAARIMENVFLKMDNPLNTGFKEYLETEVSKGNEAARLTQKLFNAQKGIIGRDMHGREVKLAKVADDKPGKGFYPQDLTKDEFHKILIDMLNNGDNDEVEKILNQRTIVVRSGEKLKAIEYTDYFKEEFGQTADELVKAAETSTDEDFNKYLLLQSAALLTENPKVDAEADKLWAELQFTPLEFTISRECYDDKLTPTVTENEELKSLLEKNKIVPYAKDTIGVRVGIVNKEGTDYLLKMKKYLPLMAENMPFNNEYEQDFTNAEKLKQTMVDADIVEVTGHNGAYRGAISIASNLPNNDKLAVKQGAGHRNVYHIQLRDAKYSDNLQPKLDALLDVSQHKYFDVQALHDFTILHENVHSLGPKNGTEKLGNLKNIIEENKADMGALVMIEPLVKAGLYTPLKEKEIIASYFCAYVLKGPDFDSAHKRRNIMQHNYFIQNGAIDINEKGQMKINYEKVIPAAKKMLSEAVRIQLDGDINKAQDYINKYSVWTPELDKLAKRLCQSDKRTNAQITSPLADMLMNGKI